ncbi:MAG: orotidine-5'-phosphate decarboxylase [Flavobacteriaceae bacterium]|nr:orotidine-5'-phosphate decarboxylase [Flavobacteriaceae bacterium]
MTLTQLSQQIKEKKSMLCVGLDIDVEKLPGALKNNPNAVVDFAKNIIDATADFTVAYKPNTAFYEARGEQGWSDLKRIIAYINSHYPKMFTIADAKRGDIGNTSLQYAKAFYEHLNFDSITLSPYMGIDSISPFLGFENKYAILLGLTSNAGAKDFQLFGNEDEVLFEKVINTSQRWTNAQQLMYVVGATKTDYLKRIRALAPKAFLLVPGVGAQGGNLAAVCQHGMNEQYGLLINASRSILYAASGEDYAEAARNAAKDMAAVMAEFIQ